MPCSSVSVNAGAGRAPAGQVETAESSALVLECLCESATIAPIATPIPSAAPQIAQRARYTFWRRVLGCGGWRVGFHARRSPYRGYFARRRSRTAHQMPTAARSHDRKPTSREKRRYGHQTRKRTTQVTTPIPARNDQKNEVERARRSCRPCGRRSRTAPRRRAARSARTGSRSPSSRRRRSRSRRRSARSRAAPIRPPARRAPRPRAAGRCRAGARGRRSPRAAR